MSNPFEVIDERLSNIESILLDLTNGKDTSPVSDQDNLLTVPEAAKFLSLSVPTVYGMIHKREIPFMKPKGGKRVYFSKQELLEWMKGSRKSTRAEIKGEVSHFLNHKKRSI